MPDPAPDIRPVLARLAGGATLSESEASATFEIVLSGGADDAQVASLLSLMAARGPTVDEIVGGARVLRRHVTPVPFDSAANPPLGSPPPVVIDTCGTGGAFKAFNVSTAAAIVAAAAAAGPPRRAVVAKHGGRSRTGRGSAEVLKHLGVNVEASPQTQARCLAEAGVCFSFAVNHHPAMKHAAGVRRSLGFTTIFNLMGPLANPARAPRQLIGTYSQEAALKLAQSLARLGTEQSLVITTHGGLDELTTNGVNLLYWVRNGEVSTATLDAATLGLAPALFDRLVAADLKSAAGMLKDVVAGTAGPALDVVLLNAGAALMVAGAASDFDAGVEMARRAVRSGAARAALESLVRISNEAEAPTRKPR